MKTALICGISGQDGGYLAALLIAKGYNVVGTSRDAHRQDFAHLRALGIRDQIKIVSMIPTDYRSVITAFTRAAPDEIYALFGQSSVGLSFDLPAETLESSIFGALNLLEAMRYCGGSSRLYHAGSSECFGDLGGTPATESTPFRPRSPYGVAKASAHMLVANYRESYGIFACNGILFNHESPHRPKGFVTAKVSAAVRAIAAGDRSKLRLGRLDIVRDWGWAPDFVEAMWLMLQQDRADDYVVATGRSFSLEAFVAAAFAARDLDWRDHVEIDPALSRPNDIAWSGGCPAHAEAQLGWRAATHMPGMARLLVDPHQSGGQIRSMAKPVHAQVAALSTV